MRGEQHRVVVKSLANSGDGVGRINQKVVFIPFAAAGDEVLVEITVSKKSFLKAKILEVITPSSARVPPRCPVFGKCGGCDWQHISYQQQLHWKKQNLVDVMTRIGGFTDCDLISDPQPSSNTFLYRNRIQLRFDEKGPHYFAKGTKKLVPIDHCPIASQPINDWLKSEKSNFKGRGKWELAENSDGTVSTFKVDEVGQSELGFRQVNNSQNQFISQKIAQFVKAQNIVRLTDLYCGQGNWSIAVAKERPEVHCLGIDNNPQNIKEALSQAQPNTEFLLGDVFELREQWQNQGELIIIDPPRAGCSPEVIQLLSNEPSTWLVYISCHPATMARDLTQLLSFGWSVESMIPVDMFPQTPHLEVLCFLRSANPAKTAK